MSPEHITTSQIFGALTPKHWVAIISTTFAAFGAVIASGYWAGQHQAEAHALGQAAELRATVGQLEAKLFVAQAKLENAANALTQWKDAYSKVQELLEKKSRELAQLSGQLGRASNCAFVQK